MHSWVADYRIEHVLDDPARPGTRFLATPPPRAAMPDPLVVIEVGPGDPADVLPDLSRWAAAASGPADGWGGPAPEWGLVVPLEVGPFYDDDGGTGTWVARRAGVVAAGTAGPPLLVVMAGAAAGLAALHRAGGIHGEVSTGRMLATPSGGLLDLPPPVTPGAPGRIVAVAATEALDTLAPEVARGDARSPAADVWALGACLYRTLTGQLVHPGLERDVLLTAVQRVIFERPALGSGDGLAALAAECLRLDPGERPTAAEVASRLDAAARVR